MTLPARLILMAALVVLGACANPYKSTYTPYESGIPASSLEPCAEPMVQQIGSIKDLQADMYKKGYALIGYSTFNTIDVPKSALAKQAADVHACVALVHRSYTHTETGYQPVFDFQPGGQYTIDTIGGVGGTTNYSGRYGQPLGSAKGTYDYKQNTTVTTPGSVNTTWLPYQKRKFDYVGSFWVKLKPPTFGLLPAKIPDQTKLKLNVEKGLMVRAVREGSPAEDAGFIAGDVITGYNGSPYVSDADFVQYIAANAGKPIEITVRREDKEIKKVVALGSKPQ